MSDYMDAVERLHARVAVNKIQPKVEVLLGLKKPMGTLDQLVVEVEKQYGADCSKMLSIAAAGGNTVVAAVKALMSKVMVGSGLCKLLMALVVTKLWINDTGRRHSQAVKDVIQVLCRTEHSDWDAVKLECMGGKMRYAELTDEDVSSEEGYQRLMPTGDSRKQQGDDWMEVVVVTASLLSYVPVELETWESIIDDWRIKDKNHWCVQRPGVSVREMMFDLRKALKDCRDRLKRINRSKKEPDEEEIVKQMMLAPLPSIKQQMRDKMKWEKLHMEKVDMVTAVRLLVEAEEELGIDESTKELVLRAAAPDAAGGRKQAGAGDVGGKGAGRSNGPPRDQQLENAKAVYAREKGHQKHEVTRAMIENDSAGGIQYWAGKYVDHRKGMHPLAREQDMDLQRKQTDARKQAGGTKLSDKAVDGVKLPAPGGKVGPPVVFQMRASSGWRSQGGSKQPGVHCMRGGDCEQTWSTELVKAVDAVYVKEKLAAGLKAWVTGVRCRKAEGHICEILREWQQQEMQVPTWEQQGDEGVEHEDGSEESTGSEYEGAWEWWLEPEEGESDEGESEEEQRCDCGAEGDHRCEATVNTGSRCDDCGGICH